VEILQPFHFAFPVHDLTEARKFYVDLLGCSEGRNSDRWVDFDLYGHQIVAHQVSSRNTTVGMKNTTNPVDGKDVPVPHFGIILEWNDWHTLADRLQKAEVKFVIEPHVRFAGKVGEEATMFFLDPSGNALEFKSFKDPTQLFAK